MKKFDRARFFPIFFLLLISLLLLGGGCGGGSSGNGTRILSMKPASPDTVNLESYTTDLEWLRNVDVAVHISASEPIDSLLCFLHLVSGDVEYDASTYRVSDLRSSANVRAANEEDPPSWIATALIEGITPGQTEYVATFDVLNALEGSISEQFVQGAKVSGVFHIDENLSDQETPEYYYVGSMTTPEPDPDTFFELSVKRIEVGSAHFLPENEGETVYDPSDPSNSSGEIYLGIPVTIKLAPQNSAVTAVTIQSASGNGNITFGDPGITAMTRILPSNTESVEMDKIDGGASELVFSPHPVDFQPSEDEDTIQVQTFTKRTLEDGEFLGVSFLLGVRITGSLSPEDIMDYLSGENVATGLNVPIVVKAEYAPNDAVSAHPSFAEGIAWESEKNAVIYDTLDLFTEDIRLLFESHLAMHALDTDYVPEPTVGAGTDDTEKDIDHYDKPGPAYIWGFDKGFTHSAGNPKYFRVGIDVSGKIYVRAFGAGLKLTGKIPLTVLNKGTFLIDVTGNAFAGDQSLNIPPFKRAANQAKIQVKVFGINVYEVKWEPNKEKEKDKRKFSVVKQLEVKKTFYEFFLPLALRAGSRGEMGIRPDLTIDTPSLRDISLSFAIIPYLDAQGFVSAELDVWAVRAGVAATLRLLKYELVPKATFGLAFEQGMLVDGVQMAMGIKPKLKFSIDHSLSTLDGYIRLFFDRKKYYVWGKWVTAATYDLLKWNGWQIKVNIFSGTILDNKTLWLPQT